MPKKISNSSTFVKSNNINTDVLIEATYICCNKSHIFENPKVVYWCGKYRNTEHKLLHKVLNNQQREYMKNLIYKIRLNS